MGFKTKAALEAHWKKKSKKEKREYREEAKTGLKVKEKKEERRKEERRKIKTQPAIKLTTPGERVFAAPEQKTQVQELEKKSGFEPTPAPIKLKPKEKEKGIAGKALEAQIKIITSPATTGVLTTVLAIVSGGGLLAGGVKAGAKVLTQKQITKQVSKEIVKLTKGGTSLIGRRIPEATITKVGKLAKLTKEGTQQLKRGLGVLRVNEVKQLIAGGANNLKTAALKTSYLARLASTAKNPFVVLSILGTTLYTSLFWAPNEKGDALVTLAIAQRDAAEAGDIDLVNEIADLIEETADIAANIPVIGFVQAELAKFEAARTASRASQAKIDKILEDKRKREEEPTFAEERETADVEARERKLEWRKEDTEHYEEQAKEKRERELLERAEDTEFFEGQDKKRRARELIEMAEDTKWFKDIADKKRAKKLKERAEDEVWWAKIKGTDLDSEEKRMLKEWNAGRSALNFKWLGT